MQRTLSVSLCWLRTVGTVTPNLAQAQTPGTTATPIQHLVVIFGENESFDHYFGTYPNALNPAGEPRFTALPGTPAVNGLTPALLGNNPNLNPANGAGAANPFRLGRSQALTADQGHGYTAEQSSFDNFAMDLFPLQTGKAGAPPKGYPSVVSTKGLVMGYYDGNTVTALWNYAQHYAISDNSFGTVFGPSTPGAINLISGQTNGVSATNGVTSSNLISDRNGDMSMVGDTDPLNDVCSSATTTQNLMKGRNVGDLLNAVNISWGWFNGGFNLETTNTNGTTGCNRSSTSPFVAVTAKDYVPHHQPFQYYPSTANPRHTPPASVAEIGFNGVANHQYDSDDWYRAVDAGILPAVSFLKAPSYQDAHPGNSNPLDEQQFVVHVVNYLQQHNAWANTAVVIAYDDSDGWYDHVVPSIVNGSATPSDTLNGANLCGNGVPALTGFTGGVSHGRCGYGVRMPLVVISPWARHNYVDHTLTDQSSVLRFIEDNWLGGQRIGQGSFDAIAGSINGMFDFTQTPNMAPYILSETTGQPVQ
jgi:phospholipase C